MSGQPYDASLKDLIEAHATDWGRFLGVSQPGNVRVIDADVSTVTGAADKALLVESEQGNYVLHPELQSSYKSDLPKRTWWYNSVYHQRLGLAVLSTVVLLRPEADGPLMTGKYEIRLPRRTEPYHIFKYEVKRLWQMPVEKLLTGGIGILPVAPLANDAISQLPQVLRTIDQRLGAEAHLQAADKLRAATSILLGLRHSQDIIDQLLKGLWPMWDHVLEDSSVIQEFVRRGEERGVKIGEERGVKIGEERGVQIGEQRAVARFRDALLRIGEKQFGPPDATIRAAIAALTDADRLATLGERISDVKSWAELMR